MARVLTENQSLLIEYLAEIGCNVGEIMRIIYNVWEPEATIEMLEFCRDNYIATKEQLLLASSKISLKYEKILNEE